MSPARAAVIVLACVALLAACALALLGWPGLAQGEGDVSFGIRPTEANPDKPETFSFFSHVLAPGETIEDAAVIQNYGDFTATAKVYVADGVTAINGGTSFTHEGFQTHGTANWVTLESGEITLGPGEQGLVSFTITVPADASAGEHVAGLVVQAAAEEGVGDAGFGVAVIRRTGVAVLVDVPGVRVAALAITGVGLNLQDDSGAVFLMDVRNDGNISLKGTGVLTVKDVKGNELATTPFNMDTILAEGETSFYLNSSILLEDGDYLIDVRADYAAARGDEVGTTAFIQNVEITVVDGQPEVEKTVPDAEAPTVVTIGGTEKETATSVNTALIMAILGAIVLAAGATGTLVMRRREPPTAG